MYESPESQASGGHSPTRRAWWFAIVITALAVIAGVAWLLAVWPTRVVPMRLPQGELTQAEAWEVQKVIQSARAAFRTSVVQTLAAAAVLTGSIIALRQFYLARLNSRIEHAQKSREFDLELFVKALEKIADGEMSHSHVRIGGLHALQQLTEQSRAYRLACCDVMAAFVRSGSSLDDQGSTRPSLSAPWPESSAVSLRHYAPDIQAAVTLIGRHNYLWFGGAYISLRRLDLRGVNLRGGHFEGIAFTECRMERAYAPNAILTGCSFKGATLDRADLRSADLSGCNIRGTRFSGSQFTDVVLEGAVFDDSTEWPDGFGAQDAIKAGANWVPIDAGPTSADRSRVKICCGS